MSGFVSDWIEAGGPIVVILGLLSLYSLALIAVKLVQLAGTLGERSGREEAVRLWCSGRRDEALNRVASARTPVARVLGAAMRSLDGAADPAAFREAVERRGNRELAVLGRHVRSLEVIAAISPLLGLLGTVLGMIEAFRELELAAGAANATVLAGGIWKALLTTAMGLMVAIPAAVAASLIPGRIARVGEEIEDAVGTLLSPESPDG